MYRKIPITFRSGPEIKLDSPVKITSKCALSQKRDMLYASIEVWSLNFDGSEEKNFEPYLDSTRSAAYALGYSRNIAYKRMEMKGK